MANMDASAQRGSSSKPGTLMPLAKQLRRASVSSIASLFDKQALTQTLDQIHSNASQSDSLTTFNDYATPPVSAASDRQKQKRPASPVGIGAWYSRVRSSVAPKQPQSNVRSDPPNHEFTAAPMPLARNDQDVQRNKSLDLTVSEHPNSTGSGPSNPPLSRNQSNPPIHVTPAQSTKSLDSHERVVVHNPSRLPPTLNAQQRDVNNSSESTETDIPTVIADSQNSRELLKRSTTPDPDGLESPLLTSEDGRPQKAASIALAKATARSDSITSITSFAGKNEKADQRQWVDSEAGIQLDLGATSPRPDAPAGERKGHFISQPAESVNSSQDNESFTSDVHVSVERQPPKDAIAALRRLQTQGLGPAVADNSHANAVGNTLTQLKNRVLSRQYWMKDENARDCFYCGDSFSTFRRKHHCRTCGQIFDAKCTTLVSGASFGQSGTIRVCKPCESVINGYDDSSDYTDDDSASIMTAGFRKRQNSRDPGGDRSPTRPSTPSTSNGRPHDHSYHSSRSNLNTFKNHLSGAVNRRFIDELKRTSGQYDDDGDRRLARPMSSRSLKSSHGLRPYVTGHRRHQSKHLLQRTSRVSETVPFHQNSDKGRTQSGKLPAFHSDNVIDPDLAAYLSDEADSDDDQNSIVSVLTGKTTPADGEAHPPSTPLSKRPSSRYNERRVPSHRSEKDFDTASISSSRNGTQNVTRRRNVSFTGSALLGSPPKPQRLSVAAHQWSTLSLDGLARAGDGAAEPSMMVRSTSLQGTRAPSVELNNASLQHSRRMLHQMLEESSISHSEAWEKALMPIMLQATDDVVPDVQSGDAINITNYVKLKKVAGGSPGDTAYISGVVFSKNLALKSMPRKLQNPNILILTFSIEYSRHEQHFMSLEPVIRQEREYLQNLVNRIAALRPNLVLVQRNVSGLALEFLNKANIAVAHNVKRSVLEAISRCCQSRIVTSIDKLAALTDSQSSCRSFVVKSFLHNGRRKTFMYLSGCPKELGCTVVLRGSKTSTLRKVKRVAEFMLQAIYNLRLETSLVRDEFALVPHYGAEGTIWYDTMPSIPLATSAAGISPTGRDEKARLSHDKSRQIDSANTATTSEPKNLRDDDQVGKSYSLEITDMGEEDIPDDIPAPTFYSDLVEKQRSRIISTSPFVKFVQPYLLSRARQLETRLTHLKRLLDQDALELGTSGQSDNNKFQLISPEMINETVKGASRKVREILQAVHESEYDKATHIYLTLTKQWENSVSGHADMFNPLSHQSITVLHSLICCSTNITCSGPDVFTMRFYDDQSSDPGIEPDCTMGQYVEDTCLSADAICGINGCEKRLHGHRRHYVHGEGLLEVTIEKSTSKAPGLESIILMWSICRKCGKETQTLPMSANTWNYSFAKYLELTFWSIPLRPRADVCPHDLHRDHWRYFGYQNWALRLQYDRICLLEVSVPRTRITWKVVNDVKFKNENFKKAERRLNKFAKSVQDRLKSIRFDTLAIEKADDFKQEIARLSDEINKDHQAVYQKLQEKYVNSKFYEIVPFNRALRMLHEKAGKWDDIFEEIELNYFPSEKDIRRLATLQLKKMFLDREESGISLTSPDGASTASLTDELAESDTLPDTEMNSTSSSRVLSPQKAHELMTSVVEDSAKTASGESLETENTPLLPALDAEKIESTLPETTNPAIDHLDLAVSPPLSPKSSVKPTLSQTNGTSQDLPEAVSKVDNSIVEEDIKAQISRSDPNKLLNPEADDNKKPPKMSGIPRLTEFARKRGYIDVTPASQRSHSQPGNGRQILKALTSHLNTPQRSPTAASFDITGTELPQDTVSHKRNSQRFSLTSMKERGQSLIPRSVGSKRSTRVSALAKHFEQLSKEFEKQRQKDQQRRALKHRQAGAYQAAALRPIVEIYRNVNEAIDEPTAELSNTKAEDSIPETDFETRPGLTARGTASKLIDGTKGDGFHAEGSQAPKEVAELGRNMSDSKGTANENDAASEIERSQDTVDDDRALQKDDSTMGDDLDIADEEDFEYDGELPNNEKTSLMKMLSNFWAERSASGWETLYYPLRDIDHVFADSDIIVREDEPSSLVALTLDHSDYQAHIKKIGESSIAAVGLTEKHYSNDMFFTAEEQRDMERSLLKETGHHLSYQFERSAAKMQCKIFWAEQFTALRKKCGVSERIVESLSRCLKWDSKGGKTKSVFLKTLDDRFVLKSLSPVETRSFLRFAPFYFSLMGQVLFHELPSMIAKLFGFYQVTIKNPDTGTDFDWYLLLMENLFYDRSPNHTFDLKGSMRNRRITPSGEQNEVLLDENMVDYIAEHPIFAREHSKKLLRSSVYNDTLFLARRNVMDYSLMLGIDENDNRSELVVGIIDYIRTYTWDKKLESWVKDRGKNRPTVTEPKDYKNRFREAINRYIMEIPTCWHYPSQPTPAARKGPPRLEASMTEKEDGLAALVEVATAEEN